MLDRPASKAAERRRASQRAYRARRRDEVIVARLPVARDVLLDFVHACGITVGDPSRGTLESCLAEAFRLFEVGALRVARLQKAMAHTAGHVTREANHDDGANADRNPRSRPPAKPAALSR
jgi:hypothetical protein